MSATAIAKRVSSASDPLFQASAVAINGRALLIEGEPGAGKSSLALALIDRGAQLIGDDGVALRRVGCEEARVRRGRWRAACGS